ncbi:hypothetical protein PINS_up020660 [Pythium insidiosum]|nr:hypothetical protein PINS_up020660 [Pythium insidiosum]
MTSPPHCPISLLLTAFDAWKTRHEVCEIALLDPRASCARLWIHVHSEKHGSVDDAAGRLPELLRVVELLTRPGIDPLALQRLADSSATRCHMGQQWCSYCDGVDRRVVLRLSPPPPVWARPMHKQFLAVLRAALFDWDESTATPEFMELRAQVLSMSRGAKRSLPIKLEINVDAVNSAAILHDLESLLTQLTSSTTSGMFEFVLRHSMSLYRPAMALIAASQIPVEVSSSVGYYFHNGACYDSDDQAEQETTAQAPPSDEEEDEMAVLSTANVIVLEATASWEEPRLDRLLTALRTRSSELQVLNVDIALPEYGVDAAGDERRREVVQGIGRALFDINSSLRLDELVLSAPICQRDLELLIGSTSVAVTQAERGDNFRHRSVNLCRFALSTFQGASLGHLLASSGGVQSLRLLSRVTALHITEIPALLRSCPSLRELRVMVSCSRWESISRADDKLSIETLVLRVSDRNASVIANGVAKLLQVVGHSLVSLSVLPDRRTTILSANLATAIAQHCPRLEQLSVRNLETGFVSNLLSVYTQEQPCKLRRLSIVSGDASERYDALITALSTATHPLARVLRSLCLNVFGWETNSENALEAQLQHMLKLNKKLHDVSLVTYFSGADLLTGDKASEEPSEWSSTVAPLRHRLATLSALRPLCLPEGVLVSILTMAGRPTVRYRRIGEFPDIDDSDIYDDDDI